MIQKTKDYAMFHMLEHNREIIPGNLKKIMSSIQVRNLLEYRPILVNKDLEVIDGQHRLEAAMRLGVDIYYEIQPDSKDEDMFLLNSNQRNWDLKDYHKYYLNLCHENYAKFDRFMKDNDLNVIQGLDILSNGSHHIRDLFRKGKFVFDLDMAGKSIKSVDQMKEICNIIKNGSVENLKFIDGSRFKKALTYFITYPGVDFETFKTKLGFKMSTLRSHTKWADYLQKFQDIYNWRNNEPVGIIRNNSILE